MGNICINYIAYILYFLFLRKKNVIMRKALIYTVFIFFMVCHLYGQDTTQALKNRVENSDTIQTETMDTTFYNLNRENAALLYDEPKVAKVVIIEKDSEIDKILTYILPIFTLILGIFIEKLIENYNTKKRIAKSGKRWNAELQSLKEPIEQQIKGFNDFNTEYGDDVYHIPNILIYPDLKGDNLKSLDKSDLLEYIDSKNDITSGIKLFNKATGVISVLDNLNNNIHEKVNDFINSSGKHVEHFNISLQEFNAKLTELHTLQQNPATKILLGEDYGSLLNLYELNIVPHLEDSNFNPFQMEKDFFIKVISLLSKYHSNPAVLIILSPIRECMNAIRGLRLEKKYIKENLTQLIKSYNDLSTSIDNITEKLK